MANPVTLLVLVVGLCNCHVMLRSLKLVPKSHPSVVLTPRMAQLLLEYEQEQVPDYDGASERMAKYAEMDEFFQDGVAESNRRDHPWFDEEMEIVPRDIYNR